MKLHKTIVLCILTIVLVSCDSLTNRAEQTSAPAPDFGVDLEIVDFIEITAPNGWNSFRTDDSVTLEIWNSSENLITCDPDSGLRIFVPTDAGWMEIKNKERYLYESIELEPTENYDPFKAVATYVRPDLPDYSVTSIIRIYVVGELLDDAEGSRKVASYIDLKLTP
jgi:hypothetical protein